jgi:hypothetical protein
MNFMKQMILLAFWAFISTAALGYEAQILKGEQPASLEALIIKANNDTQLKFRAEDFYLIEDRQLATSRFQMFVQHNNKVPIEKTAVRIWSHKSTNELILAEMHLDESSKKEEQILNQKFRRAKFSSAALKSKKLSQAINLAVEKELKLHKTDNKIIGMKFKDVWSDGDLVRQVEVRGRRGVHHLSVSLLKNKILKKSYSEFPQSEKFHSLLANVFPIYEEAELTGEKLPYETKVLKYIHSHLHDGGENPLAAFENMELSEHNYHPIMAETIFGQAQGLWSEAALRRQVDEVIKGFPLKKNSLKKGLLLQGKYATINLHPDVTLLKDVLQFPLKASTNHLIQWSHNSEYWQAKPKSGFYGLAIKSEEELLARIPERLPDHDPVTYINSGFDEIQVYYGVTVLMEALKEMGFEDPELSSEPFHAFLFDPDLSMKDNAYYYDNTINFTTYNPGSPNMARDNPTIWHELGHGIMDRLMGPHLGFADSEGGYGGLSEGMADFVAQIVLKHQISSADFPGKNDFRIINETGFYLTNEFHDEGEAYGGAMNDMLEVIIGKEGREGLFDFTDLTLEAMRLTRNHPALSPRGWFEHMLYADSLGSEVRSPGQYHHIIMNALEKRNFSFVEEFNPAEMKIEFENGELTSESPASRNRPISACGMDGFIHYYLKVSLVGGDADFIKFPAMVKIEYQKGPLQGAIRWVGEEHNPQVFIINSPNEILTLPLKASVECEYINQPDGSCKDYAYIQIFNPNSSRPVAKKRFYLKLKKEDCE